VSALKICPTCGAEYPAEERFCPRDGTALRSPGASGDDLVGSIIAERYHVLKKLGEGGMGQVYLAEHVKMGRKSAVKVMSPGMVHDADAISRFNREAANASRITHPNVAGIYDFGETPDGVIYLAMEFVEGEPLTSLVERSGALPPMRAAEIARQTGEALSAAHDMGIVHRDLKPDNIMIAKNRDGSDTVKVVDFGIAKAAGSEVQKVTRTGLVVGTPAYMSPEQLAGDKLDGRSDVYSLGLVTFNMFTGALPFPSETAQEAMIMRLTERPKSLAEVRPDVPWTPEVQAVMDRALERDAKTRFQTASEFGRALYDTVSRMPLTSGARLAAVSGAAAVPPTRVATPEPRGMVAAGAPARMTPMLVGGGAVVIAATVAGVLFMSHGGTKVVRADSARAASPPAEANSTAASPPSSRAPAPGSAVAGAIAARLPVLLDESAVDTTASRALVEASRLMPRATGSDRIGLALVQAQALGLRNDTARACPILRRVRNGARGTAYERAVASLLKSSC
jgi:serine/threonine-protein kinase